MLALTLLVVSVALADSLNPSTVVPALWLAGASRGRGLLSFTLGVFLVYLAGGVVLVFGPGPVLIAAFRHVGGTVEHALLAAGGAVAIAFAAVLWRSRHRVAADRPVGRRNSRGAAFALGAGIMAVELPTAFIYFGAISAILSARAGAPAGVSLLVAYNALFVAPLLAILVIRLLTGERGDRWLVAGETWLRGAGQLIMVAVVALAGAALVTVGVSGLAAG